MKPNAVDQLIAARAELHARLSELNAITTACANLGAPTSFKEARALALLEAAAAAERYVAAAHVVTTAKVDRSGVAAEPSA